MNARQTINDIINRLEKSGLKLPVRNCEQEMPFRMIWRIFRYGTGSPYLLAVGTAAVLSGGEHGLGIRLYLHEVMPSLIDFFDRQYHIMSRHGILFIQDMLPAAWAVFL
jgi:hypothetical protein